MPLPEPGEKEEEDAFIARCMGNPTVKDDFKDQKQRLAVCFSQWRRKHPQASGQYSFYASMHSPYEKDGKRYALLRVITTQASAKTWPVGERWRPSYDSLRRCLGTILHAPLIGPPCKPGQSGTCGHLAHRKMGHPVDWTMPNGYAEVIYEITDDEAWRNLQSGEWHDVSPRITWSQRHFEGDVAVADDWFFEHVAFVDKGAFENVEVIDWWQGDPQNWYRLAAEFQGHNLTDVTDGAGTRVSPDRDGSRQLADQTKEKRGGISLTDKETSSNSQTLSGADAWNTADAPDKFFAYVPESAKGADGNKSERKIPLASVQKKDYDEAIIRNSVARLPQSDISDKAAVLAKICSVAKSMGLDLPSCESAGDLGGRTQMSTEKESNQNPCADKAKELEAQVQKLQGELAAEKQRTEIMQKNYKPPEGWKAEFDGMKAELQNLREERQHRLEAERAAKVDRLVDLRIRGNLIGEGDRTDESKRYATLQAEALDMMIADAEVVVAQVESGGPKAKPIK